MCEVILVFVTLINSYLYLSMQKYTSGNTSHHSFRSLQVSPAFSDGNVDQCTKVDLQARLLTFDYSGLDYRLSYNLIRHFRSFVGRDFKALAQISLFLLGTKISEDCLARII